MLHAVLRLLFWLAIIFGAIAIIAHSRVKNKKRLYLISTGVLILLWELSATYLPIEKMFMVFPSPEAAYQYTHVEPLPSYVIEGADTDMVIGVTSDGTCDWSVFRKTADGWKAGTGVDLKSYQYTFLDLEIFAQLYQHKVTGDCYLWITCPYNGSSMIQDNNQSHFFEDPNSNKLHSTGSTAFYAYIGKPSGNYSLTVNGTNLTLTGIKPLK